MPLIHARYQWKSKLKEPTEKKVSLKGLCLTVKHDLPPPDALKQHHMIGWLVRTQVFCVAEAYSCVMSGLRRCKRAVHSQTDTQAYK